MANDQCDLLFESCDEAVLVAAAEDDAPAEGEASDAPDYEGRAIK
ncbi:MAG: hypothetical protein ACE1ZG_04810 [Gammaproteobacteria bacterium]